MIKSLSLHAKERLTVSHLVKVLVLLDPTFIEYSQIIIYLVARDLTRT